MDLDWDDLRIFVTAARKGSLRAAAELLDVNHATIHRAIERLEKKLNARLFDRSRSGLSLTSSGEILLPHAEEMEAQSFELARKITGSDLAPEGEIKVSLPPALVLGFIMPIIKEFTKAYPDIKVTLDMTNRISDLARQEADVSIRVAHEVSDDVVGRRLVRFNKAYFASPTYLKAHPDIVETGGKGAHWIGWGTMDEPGWIKNTPFPNAGIRHAMPEASAQIEAAAADMGIMIMAAFLADRDPRLVRIPDTPVVPDRSIWLLLHHDLRRTARIRAFVDFVFDYVAKDKARYTC